MFAALRQTVAAGAVLDTSTKLGMNPMELRTAGVVIQNMQGEGFSDADINHVCRRT